MIKIHDFVSLAIMVGILFLVAFLANIEQEQEKKKNQKVFCENCGVQVKKEKSTPPPKYKEEDCCSYYPD